MRVTNGMIINTTINGLYTNMNTLNKTYAKMVSGKKIQTVSDDPIIAGRALKLTTNVLETSQYERNVKEAQSWTDVTDASLANIESILVNKVREKFVQGSTGTNNKENKESIRTQVEQLWKQIQDEANGTYAGRYVFCGYKTSQPMVLTSDYKIEASGMEIKRDTMLGSNSTMKSGSNIAIGSKISVGSKLGTGTKIYGKCTLGSGAVLSQTDATNLLKVSYNETNDTCSFTEAKTLEEGKELTSSEVNELNSVLHLTPPIEADADGNYKVPAGGVTIPANTAVSNKLSKSLLGVGGSIVTSSGTSTVKFTTTKPFKDIIGAGANYTLSGEAIVGAGSVFEGNIVTNGDTVLAANSVLKEGTRLTADSTLGKGTLNPEIIGKIDGQNIEYEIGTNSSMAVNVEGLDKVMVRISECFNEVFLKLDEALVDESITKEDLNLMFTGKIKELDSILGDISEISSNLGSRQNRLDYVESRLSDQKMSFKTLLTSTEDVDIEEVYTDFNVQYATYQSALQATSKIITNTLADYL